MGGIAFREDTGAVHICPQIASFCSHGRIKKSFVITMSPRRRSNLASPQPSRKPCPISIPFEKRYYSRGSYEMAVISSAVLLIISTEARNLPLTTKTSQSLLSFRSSLAHWKWQKLHCYGNGFRMRSGMQSSGTSSATSFGPLHIAWDSASRSHLMTPQAQAISFNDNSFGVGKRRERRVTILPVFSQGGLPDFDSEGIHSQGQSDKGLA